MELVARGSDVCSGALAVVVVDGGTVLVVVAGGAVVVVVVDGTAVVVLLGLGAVVVVVVDEVVLVVGASTKANALSSQSQSHP